jgi:Protein of unknown function (DUF4238)
MRIFCGKVSRQSVSVGARENDVGSASSRPTTRNQGMSEFRLISERMEITKRQHQVPSFYLRQWARKGTQVACHDLQEERYFVTSAEAVLAQRYYYEEDANNPDNRVEKLLSRLEGEWATHFARLSDIDLDNATLQSAGATIQAVTSILTEDAATAIKSFAAYQYLRVPGALNQKRFELGALQPGNEELDQALNPGRFVESGYKYVKERFQGMKLLIQISTGQDFVTSDWPCFDAKESADAPILGEEIGKNAEVVAYVPLTPRIGAILFPSSHLPNAHLMPTAHVVTATDAHVRNQNTLVIQQSERFVIARDQLSFIFKVAAKRKKSTRKPAPGR